MRDLINIIENAQKLNELFQSDSEIDWKGWGDLAFFKVGDIQYQASFSDSDGDNNYTFNFKSITTQDAAYPHWTTANTGESGGKAVKVFSIVVKILTTFIEEHQPESVKFSGDNEDGKAKLYTKMAEFLKPRLINIGYTVDVTAETPFTWFVIARARA